VSTTDVSATPASARSRSSAAAPSPALGTALRLSGVRKVYAGPPEVRAVDGIDLEVVPGEMFGLLGPNGAGKSTTVGMCTTRIRPSDGAIEVGGLDVVAHPARVKRRIGVVTQDNTLDRSLTLRENLLLHCRYFGWSGREARTRADELLERFRLADRGDAFPRQISGGMAQRLQVARAIAHRPQLLFLDEPTAGLDPQSRLALWELVEELRQDGLTVVLTTHYMEEADQLCDRVAIVDHGRVLVCDTPQRLKDEHGTGVVLDLCLAAPAEASLLTALAAVPGVTGAERTDTGARVHARDADGLLARVVGVADRAGLSDLSVTGASLEGVFIALTGRDLRE
jgi:ABC-2 type transport system ATP-binding protein